jgi:hypothetical protein
MKMKPVRLHHVIYKNIKGANQNYTSFCFLIMTKNLHAPILFLIFNRPDFTKRVFERIRAIKPSQLYIAADGPRHDRNGESILCLETRNITENIDWECTVHRLYRNENVGCKTSISSAISWFFDHVESGIILEDDCFPDETFFRYCEELLEFYKDDKSILSIGGHNLGYTGETRYSYGFTRYMNMWGWATWADRAKQIDYTACAWKKASYRNKLRVNMSRDFHPILRHDPEWWNYWQGRFGCVLSGEFDTWDYQWVMHGLAKNMRSIFPTVNLIRNVGFGDGATHTFNKDQLIASLPQQEMHFPLRHPTSKSANKEYECTCVRKNWCGLQTDFERGFFNPYIKILRWYKKKILSALHKHLNLFCV